MPGCRPLAHPVNVARPPYPSIKLHRIHLPAFSSLPQAQSGGTLLRDGQGIRPFPLTTFSPGFTHLAVGITRACIRSGRRGRFFNAVDLVNKLDAEARADRQGRTADLLCRLDC